MPTPQKPTSGPKRTAPITRGERLAAEKAKAKKHKKKPQTLMGRLASLSTGAWTAIISAVVVVVFVVILVNANSHHPATGSSSTPVTVSDGTGTPTVIGTLSPDKGQSGLNVGDSAPAFGPFKGADGKMYRSSDFKGKVILLELFAPWCPYCRAEAPTLNQVQTNMASQGVQAVAVSASPYWKDYESTGVKNPISFSDITWYAQTYHVNFPMLFDPALQTVNAYGLQGGYPTLYIINKHGEIAYTTSGAVTYADLQNQLTQALNQ